MAKPDGIKIEVKLDISDETVAACIVILNTWLKENGDGLVICERKDGTQYIEVKWGKNYEKMSEMRQIYE